MNSATGIGRPLGPGAAGARSRLRLVDKPGAAYRAARRLDKLALVEPDGPAEPADHVLVAGSDAPARERMLAELRSLLPSDTRFLEAAETWEVVARAAGSRMVVLTGDLDEVSAGALLRLLARRNPSLPVLAVGNDRRAHVPSAGEKYRSSAPVEGVALDGAGV